MEEGSRYEQSTKEELIQLILDQQQTLLSQQQTLLELRQTIVDLKKEIEALKHPVRKDSTNSSIPSSKEQIPHTRSQRKKSDKKAGGQPGHEGHQRERHPHPDKIIMVQTSHCSNCGTSLDEVEGTIGHIAEANRYSSYYPTDHRVPTSDQGVCLWTLQLSGVTHPRTCHNWATNGSPHHLLQCGTLLSL